MIRKTLIVTFIAIGVFIIISIAMMMKMRLLLKEQKKVRDMAIPAIDMTKVSDGTYEGNFTYLNSSCAVEVQVKDHKIVTIKILKNSNTSHAKKAEAVIDRIIQVQSLKVDAVTGATTTSKALMKAVENALVKGMQK
jgi:uncharacterized protein with FMN-binding domain